jgi:hypothetical protein
MRQVFSPVFEAAPAIDGLVASAIRNTDRHLEWSYYNPDDCTIDGRHMRVRFAPRQHFQTSIEVFERSRPMRSGHYMINGTPSIADVVRSVEREQQLYFSDKRPLFGTQDERDAAFLCLKAGFHR